MFFKRLNGKVREMDRTTRFKLIKSGKHWVRSENSTLGLFKIVRGEVETRVVTKSDKEQDGIRSTSQFVLKGLLATEQLLVLPPLSTRLLRMKQELMW